MGDAGEKVTSGGVRAVPWAGAMADIFDIFEVLLGWVADHYLFRWLYDPKRKKKSSLAGEPPDSIGIWNVPSEINGTDPSALSAQEHRRKSNH